MADDDTTTAPAPAPGGLDLNNPIIQQLLQGGGAIQGPPAPTTPAVNRNLPFTGMLGEALGGGVSPLYPMSEAQQTQAGNAALLNFGINMLQNSSGPVRHSLGQAIASGLLGAQGSLAGVREGQAQTLEVQNKQQTMQLERLKTLLPLLRMQQAAGMPNPLLGSGPAPGGTLAATGAPITAANQGDFVQKFTPMAQTISEKTGLPVNYVIAQAGLETGWGSSPAAARNNYFGISDSSGKPLSYASPEEGIKAYTDLMATDRYKNVPRTGSPAAIGDAMAVAGYNPNVPRPGQTDSYGTRVGSFAAGLGKPPAPPTTTAAAPPPAPVARPPAAPVALPGTIQGTPDAGGTPVAGPGALPGPIRPPGPLVPGDVKAMIGGMTGAGANAATLAPGGGTAAPIAPPVSTVVAANAPVAQQPTQADQPPAPTGPMTIEQYRAQHPITVDPATFTVTPPNLDNLQRALNEATQRRDLALKGYGGNVDKAGSDFREASKAMVDAQQAAQTKSLELQQAAQKDAEDRRDKAYNDELTRQQQAKLNADQLAQTVAENEKNRVAENARLTQAGQQAIALEQARGRTADESKVMDSLNETRESARTAIDQLGLARSLSQQAGDPTFWQTVQQSHPQLVQALANMGALNNDQVTQLGYAGASDAAMNKLISMARTGSGFQRMTNLDVQILSSQAPKAVDPQAWRDAKMDYLQTYMARQMQYVDNVRSLRADGTPLYEAQKRAAADTGDIVPQIPNFTDTPQKSAVQQRIEWAQDRLSPNTFFRAPDGKLVIYRGPQAQTEQQTTAPAPTKSLVPVN